MKKALIVLLAISSLMACQKDPKPEPEPEKPNIIGYWEGTFKDGDGPNGYFGFLYRADSTVRIYIDDDASKDSSAALGKIETTFSLVEDWKKIKTTYTYFSIQLSTLGTLNATATAQEGTWGNGTNTSGRGTFSVTKK